MRFFRIDLKDICQHLRSPHASNLTPPPIVALGEPLAFLRTHRYTMVPPANFKHCASDIWKPSEKKKNNVRTAAAAEPCPSLSPQPSAAVTLSHRNPQPPSARPHAQRQHTHVKAKREKIAPWKRVLMFKTVNMLDNSISLIIFSVMTFWSLFLDEIRVAAVDNKEVP